MSDAVEAFPTRKLRFGALESLEAAPDPERINQHIEGQRDPTRVMTDEEVERLLSDPFAELVLRRGVFPDNLDELLDAFDAQSGSPQGLDRRSSFLISEGGQIRFQPGLDKGGSRLITVLSRGASPEVMISTLVPAGASARSGDLLNEVLAWDPRNRTFHFYQRQAKAWFWCGQSDMALVEPTRGRGPFDSHVNGYPVMKELQTPWVHWHGPGLGVAETAYGPDDPLVTDPLFVDKDHALTFETRVIRPLAARWNQARFEKALTDGRLQRLDQYARQVVTATTGNLISSHREWSQIDAAMGPDDVPASFFVDLETLAGTLRLPIEVPPLRLDTATYAELVATHDLRVRGGSVDQPGDVPFCFTVPERAHEDNLALAILVQQGVLSRRLAACLAMVDFTNPLNSTRRAALLAHFPDSAGAGDAEALDQVFVDAVRAAPDGDAETEFLEHWDLGPTGWEETFADRIEAYLRSVAQRLTDAAGNDDIFRLAESRRREFDKRSIAEFDLSLPRAAAIPADTPALEMLPDASVRPRP